MLFGWSLSTGLTGLCFGVCLALVARGAHTAVVGDVVCAALAEWDDVVVFGGVDCAAGVVQVADWVQCQYVGTECP